MRARLVLLAALLVGGCASAPHEGSGGPPPRDGYGPPPGEGGPRSFGRGRTFISPMGEPFRGEPGGVEPAAAWFAGADANHDGHITRTEFEADALRFFALLDSDRDGEIGPAELDRYEEEIAPEVRAGGGGFGGGRPEGGGRGGRGGGGRHGGGGGGPPGGGGGGRGGGPPGGGGDGPDGGGAPSDAGGRSAGGGVQLQGAARFGYLALPEPVIAADADFNRGVSRAEFVAAARMRFALLDRDGDGVLTEAELPKPGGRQR